MRFRKCACIYIHIYLFDRSINQDRSAAKTAEEGEMIRIQEFELLEASVAGEAPATYDSGGGMLSEMLKFPGGGGGGNNSSLESSFVDQGLHQYTWIPGPDSSRIGTVMEVQGLSLSLSSSWRGLEGMEGAKLEELSSRNGGIGIYSNNNTTGADQLLLHNLHSGVDVAGYGGGAAAESTRTVNVLRNSRYLKAAQELLEEFCFVGRGKLKNLRAKKNIMNNDESGNPNSDKDHPPPSPPSSSPAVRSEHQRRKIKLLSMLDEACNSFLFLSISNY